MMISSIATFSWSALRLRRGVRLWVLLGVGLLGTALVNAPWIALSVICALYLLGIPLGIRSYSKVRRPGTVREPTAS